MSLWRYGPVLLSGFDPETAHRLTVKSLKAGIGPRRRANLYPSLRTRVAGLEFPNPLGLAAGFDKNAEVPDAMLHMGFGFVEVGAVTPLAQTGNPAPRVFRLQAEQAVINRYGFNNEGLEAIKARLMARRARGGIVGINLGANKTSEDRTADYVTGLQALSPYVDFCTVNISSPNTPGLRALQGKAALAELLQRVLAARTDATPVFLKIAPDLTDEDKTDIVAAVLEAKIDGLVVSNTTIGGREGLLKHGAEAGGLSGRPLFALSTQMLRDMARGLGGAVPLIGVGGVFSSDDAYTKIKAGASLVQLYTGLVYKGPDLVRDILEGLNERLALDGFESVKDAVGAAL